MQIDPKILRLLVPALAGAAGTGAMGAYLSHNYRPANETPAQRRRRIMRNGLVAAGLGGVAGAALPEGLRRVSEPFTGSSSHVPLLERGMDNATSFGLNHALGLGVGGAGLAAVRNYAQRNAGAARGELFNALKGSEIAGQQVKNPSILKQILAHPDSSKALLSSYLHSMSRANPTGTRNNPFYVNELMQEAGGPGLSVDELATHLGGQRGNVLQDLESHLAAQGPISRLVSRFATNETPMLGGITPARIAEGYSKYMRPGVGRIAGRTSPLLLTALAGGGALLGDKLQQRVMGN